MWAKQKAVYYSVVLIAISQLQNSCQVMITKDIPARREENEHSLLRFRKNPICFTLNPFQYLFIFQLMSRIPHWKSFEGVLCSEANHNCPARPLAAVGLRQNESCVIHLSPISPMQMPDMCDSARP